MTNHPHRRAPSPPPTQALHQALAQARARAGLTQRQCAQMLGASLRTWEQWEQAQRSVPGTALELWLITCLAEGLLPADDPLAALMVRPSVLQRVAR